MQTVETLETSEFQGISNGHALISSISNIVQSVNRNIGNARGALHSATENCSEIERGSNAVAQASQGVRTSISDISRQAKSASETIEQIVRNVGLAQENSKTLERSVEHIASVTVLIKNVARQTNLLALNATIEAARVGEAGRGFSVVANEVKELANQTSRATEDIAAQVKQIQSASTETIASIRLISADIGGMASRIAAIAETVDQQEYSVTEIITAIETCTTSLGSLRAALENIQRGAATNFERTTAAADLLQKLQSES